jgi:glycosyltransferase involved in cell wall biosynthesis
MKIETNILFYHEIITSYQIDFFDSLNKLKKIKVIYFSKKYKNYNLQKYKRDYLQYIHSKNELKKIIANENPKNIIIGGYKLKHFNIIKKSLKKGISKYFFWLERLEEDRKIKNFILSFLIKKRLQDADGILCVGNKACTYYKRYNKNILNLPYSIKINFIKKDYFYNKKINLLFVGQLIKRKGIDIILKIIKDFDYILRNSFKFIIVGNGNYSVQVAKAAKTFDFVKYYNFMKNNELRKIYKKSDVLLYPSRFDGWGVVPMEAINYKIPLIISNKSGFALDYIKDKKNGILIKKTNKGDLLKAIKFFKARRSIFRKIGLYNHRLLRNSLMNSTNSAKRLINYLNH